MLYIDEPLSNKHPLLHNWATQSELVPLAVNWIITVINYYSTKSRELKPLCLVFGTLLLVCECRPNTWSLIQKVQYSRFLCSLCVPCSTACQHTSHSLLKQWYMWISFCFILKHPVSWYWPTSNSSHLHSFTSFPSSFTPTLCLRQNFSPYSYSCHLGECKFIIVWLCICFR